MHLDFLPSKGIPAVGHTCSPERIGNQDYSLGTEQMKSGANDTAVDVNSVANQLHLNIGGIKSRSDNTGRPVEDLSLIHI